MRSREFIYHGLRLAITVVWSKGQAISEWIATTVVLGLFLFVYRYELQNITTYLHSFVELSTQ